MVRQPPCGSCPRPVRQPGLLLTAPAFSLPAPKRVEEVGSLLSPHPGLDPLLHLGGWEQTGTEVIPGAQLLACARVCGSVCAQVHTCVCLNLHPPGGCLPLSSPPTGSRLPGLLGAATRAASRLCAPRDVPRSLLSPAASTASPSPPALPPLLSTAPASLLPQALERGLTTQQSAWCLLSCDEPRAPTLTLRLHVGFTLSGRRCVGARLVFLWGQRTLRLGDTAQVPAGSGVRQSRVGPWLCH